MSIRYFIPQEGDFDSFNEFTACAIDRELQNLRNVCSFATTELVRFSGAVSWVVMELQAVKIP